MFRWASSKVRSSIDISSKLSRAVESASIGLGVQFILGTVSILSSQKL